METTYRHNEFRFTSKIERTPKGNYYWSVKVAGDTIDEWQKNMEEMTKRMKKFVKQLKESENV